MADDINTEEIPDCLFCDIRGTELYAGLCDHWFSAPGKWRLLYCSSCGLVWLSPRPLPIEVGKIYETYYTHADNNQRRFAYLRAKVRRALCASSADGYEALSAGWLWKCIGRTLAWLPSLRERALLGVLYLTNSRGKLLDVGCGSGSFVEWMRETGWDAIGIDSDSAAVGYAQNTRRLPVFAGTLEHMKFRTASFDAVTMSHVIEHVHDPVALLAECRRILAPGGRLVIVTPNIDSYGHKKFGNLWRGLEPPRHLHIFSQETLRLCVENAGLKTEMVRTTARGARMIWQASEKAKNKRSSDATALGMKLRCLMFELQESSAVRKYEPVGEELIMVCSPGAIAR